MKTQTCSFQPPTAATARSHVTAIDAGADNSQDITVA